MAALLGIVGMLTGLALAGASVVLMERMGFLTSVLVAGAGTVIVFLSMMLTFVAKFFRRATADEAFVRTGLGGARVVLDGGAFVLPTLHRVVPVSLRQVRLAVERNGEDAVTAGDGKRLDIAAEFHIKVQPDANDILTAARSPGETCVSEETIRELMMEKLISTLETVAATKSHVELKTKRDEFASAVQSIVAEDFRENGLTLTGVVISCP
jgi:uncharacterized membrane protein YqiK